MSNKETNEKANEAKKCYFLIWSNLKYSISSKYKLYIHSKLSLILKLFLNSFRLVLGTIIGTLFWLLKMLNVGMDWLIEKRSLFSKWISHIFKKILLPVKITFQDKVLLIWIITTLLGGFFTFFSDLLLGKDNPFEEVQNTGSIYVFSITLLLPVIADIIIYIWTEEGKRIIRENKKDENENNNSELNSNDLKEKNISRNYISILVFSILVVYLSILLFIGTYKTSLLRQLLSAVISFYITYYYYCLTRKHQNAFYFNNLSYISYIDDEKNKIDNMQKQAENLTEEDKEKMTDTLKIENDKMKVISNTVNKQSFVTKESADDLSAELTDDSNEEEISNLTAKIIQEDGK